VERKPTCIEITICCSPLLEPFFYPNTWYQILTFLRQDLEAHEYFTRWQKQLGVMGPNTKLFIEELMKEVRGELKSMQKEMRDG
jgi:hypothetical protein